MRLLYFLNHITNSGGMERIVIDKINYLSNVQNFHVMLAYFGHEGDKPFYPIDSKVSLYPMHINIDSNSFIGKAKILSKTFRIIRKLLGTYKPDIIINANTILVGWLLPFIHGNIPTVVEHHFSYKGMMMLNEQIYGNNRLKGWLNTSFRKFFYPRYDKCVVLTKEDAELWGFRNNVVIPNFTSLNIDTDTCLNSKKEKMVISVGRLSEEKDFKTLIDSWREVHKLNTMWKLEIWGEGPKREELQNQIIKFGLENVITLKGVTMDIAKQYQRASFFVLSSKFEGLPMCILEAMQCGLPCISFDITGAHEIIQNDKNGLIAKERSSAAMTKCLLKIMYLDDIEYEKMSEAAKLTSQLFDKETIMKQWIELFEELAYQ